MAKTVIAYEDEPALRQQLENIFYAIREEFNLIAAFPDARNVMHHLSAYKPEIVIMDIRMDDEEDGLIALFKIKKRNPEIKVLMLTTFDADDKVFNSICLGADGYMLKTDFSAQQLPHEVIRKSLKIMLEGGAYLTPTVAKQILKLFSDDSIADRIQKARNRFLLLFSNESKSGKKIHKLSRMQKSVLEKIVDGKTTPEIAKELSLAENTINSHVKQIFSVLEVHSRSMAVKKALEEKLIRREAKNS